MWKVRVVISTYNGEKNIERQLDSIFAQEGINVGVLIRDDSSTDNTLSVLKKYKENYPQRDIHIEIGKNIGFAKSFWLGLKLCDDADYYAFADQDDVWKKNKIIKSINAMKASDEVPQLSYCRMQRSNTCLERLDEQVEVLRPQQLTKKLTLTQTYNYGAATVINRSARNLVCRIWPDVEELPHDMWIGTLCYWFGKVYYIDEELYYWIRYNTSVTGEGTKKTGIQYRIMKTFQKKSYPNICGAMLHSYSDLLSTKDRKFLERVIEYRTNMKDKILLLMDPTFRRVSISGTLALKLGIILGWY